MQCLKTIVCWGLVSTCIPAFGDVTKSLSSDATTKSSATYLNLEQQMQSYVPQQPFTEKDDLKFKKYSPWRSSWFSWATQNMEDTRDGVAQLSVYNYIGLDYRLSGDSKLSLRPTFYLNGAGNNIYGDHEESSFELGDIYLQYARYNLALLPFNIGMLGAFRVYIPTSEFSKQTHTITQLRAKMTFFKPIAHGAEVTYILEPKYYIYSQRGYRDEWWVKGNKAFELKHYAELAQRFSRLFGIAGQVGMKHSWYYSVPSADIDSRINDRFEVSVNALIDIEGVSFKAGLNNSIDVRRPRHDFRLFRESETDYSLMTYVRF